MMKQRFAITRCLLFCLLLLIVTKSNAQTVFTFYGNGNWNIASNWSGNSIPPSIVPDGYEIIISPQAGGSCISNVPLTILTGARITVSPGANFILAVKPANILNLTNWKLNLPIDANGTQTGTSVEIKRPQLDTFSIYPWFRSNNIGNGVIFNANCGGATTSGSGYPRSELREMTNNGTASASWSSSAGTHIMEIDQAITHLPDVKKHIVVGQIHDANDDVIVFRLENKKLFMDHNGLDGVILDNNYILGTRFKVKFVVANNQVMSYYNDVLKETYPVTFTNSYFKAGAYVQSSCKGIKQVAGELCSAYGEVVIYNVTVTHQ